MFGMNADEVSCIAAIAQAVLAFLAVVSSVLVSLFIYFGTKKIAMSQYFQTLNTSWGAIDSTVLLENENLRVVNSLFHPDDGSPDDLDLARKRWIGYMFLNPLEIAFVGVQRGYLDSRLLKNIERNLSVLLRDDIVFALSQNGIYQPAFSDLCLKLREQSATPKQALQQTAVSSIASGGKLGSAAAAEVCC